MHKKALIILSTGLAVPHAFGISETHLFSGLNLAIPDGAATGQYSNQIVDSGFNSISHLKVFLTIEGDFNGDLYGLLSHEGGAYSVLLNRVGRTSLNPFGSEDHGFAVTLDDNAPDIHLAGPSPQGLTGTWSPDGREHDPASALDTESRTAFLSSFNAINPDGEWTLFIADLESGGTSELVAWGLEFESNHEISVPESGRTAYLLAFGFAGIALMIRSGRRSMSARSKA